MDNNEVYALFEDIRNGLKGINDKLENAPKVSNDQSREQVPAMDMAPIKELFDSSAKEHQAQTKAMLTKFGEAEVYASNKILRLLRDLKELFVRSSEERKGEPQEHISISTAIVSTSGRARSFLFWSAWVSCAVFPSGATSSFGNPNASMQTMP